MSSNASAPVPRLLGAIIGWRHHRVAHGHLLRLQTARSDAAAKIGDICEVDLVLTTNQMRALSADLTRTADESDNVSPRRKMFGWW